MWHIQDLHAGGQVTQELERSILASYHADACMCPLWHSYLSFHPCFQDSILVSHHSWQASSIQPLCE